MRAWIGIVDKSRKDYKIKSTTEIKYSNSYGSAKYLDGQRTGTWRLKNPSTWPFITNIENINKTTFYLGMYAITNQDGENPKGEYFIKQAFATFKVT